MSHADEPPPVAAQLHARLGAPELAGLAAAVERVLRAEVDSLEQVRMSGTPALALDDLQLMVGCLGETDECYAAMATQLDVDILLMPALDQVGQDRVLTVVAFDRRTSTRRSARRSHPNDETLVGSVRPLLRELFGLPVEPEVVAPEVATPRPRGEVPLVEAPRSGPGVVPGVVVAGVGVAALGAAIGLGLAASSAEDDYRDAPVRTVAEVDAALTRRSEAASLRTGSTALYVTGGALVAGGVVLAILLGRDRTDASVSVSPAVGRSSFGLVVGGSL
ncbi:MAG: hypothetical protein H6721_15965 [Sandaracinus sp.]|nr:hypothetical protein [Sandaracinus sp.]MCB9633613.1 hypothetical protein [Sandaracinus sp.]